MSVRSESLERLKLREILPDNEAPKSGLCADSPTNFLGALLYRSIIPELLSQEPQLSEAVPQNWLNPYFLLRAVKLRYFDRGSLQVCDFQLESGETVRAPDVLIKIGCGRIAGLVLTGPLAGLLLRVDDSLDQNERGYPPELIREHLFVARLANESAIGPGFYGPYEPACLPNDERNFWELVRFSSEIRDEAKSRIADRASQLQERGVTPYLVRDILTPLIADEGLPLEPTGLNTYCPGSLPLR